MSGRSCTAGNQGRYETGNAVEWGLCGCGEGSNEENGWEAPLFEHSGELRCFGCCEDADEVTTVNALPIIGIAFGLLYAAGLSLSTWRGILRERGRS